MLIVLVLFLAVAAVAALGFFRDKRRQERTAKALGLDGPGVRVVDCEGPMFRFAVKWDEGVAYAVTDVNASPIRIPLEEIAGCEFTGGGGGSESIGRAVGRFVVGGAVADAMDSVPKSFPPLLRAYKIQKKAADVGFDWNDALEALPKVHEEADEVKAAIEAGDKAAIEDEVGDLFFAAVNVARLKKVDPDLALTAATDKFERRFKLTERLIREDGKRFEDMTLPEMDKYWDRAKELLKED